MGYLTAVSIIQNKSKECFKLYSILNLLLTLLSAFNRTDMQSKRMWKKKKWHLVQYFLAHQQYLDTNSLLLPGQPPAFYFLLKTSGRLKRASEVQWGLRWLSKETIYPMRWTA